jgi:hypothetical protein
MDEKVGALGRTLPFFNLGGGEGNTHKYCNALPFLEGCTMVECARSFSQLFIYFITFKFKRLVHYLTFFSNFPSFLQLFS